jgi:flagellar protein FlaG
MEIRPVANSPQPTSTGIERDPSVPSPASAPASAAGPVSSAGIGKGSPHTDADLHRALERINQSLSGANQGIEFSVDPDSERVIVKVVDRETNEVLRQMPSQEALDIAKALDRTQGLLIKLEA